MTLLATLPLEAPVDIAPTDAAPAPRDQVVLPRQYDVMFGPVYQPAPGPAPRAGSQDFRRIASHGYGC